MGAGVSSTSVAPAKYTAADENPSASDIAARDDASGNHLLSSETAGNAARTEQNGFEDGSLTPPPIEPQDMVSRRRGDGREAGLRKMMMNKRRGGIQLGVASQLHDSEKEGQQTAAEEEQQRVSTAAPVSEGSVNSKEGRARMLSNVGKTQAALQRRKDSVKMQAFLLQNPDSEATESVLKDWKEQRDRDDYEFESQRKEDRENEEKRQKEYEERKIAAMEATRERAEIFNNNGCCGRCGKSFEFLIQTVKSDVDGLLYHGGALGNDIVYRDENSCYKAHIDDEMKKRKVLRRIEKEDEQEKFRRDMVLERWKAQDKVRDRKKKSRAAIEKKLMAAIEKGEVEGLLKKETKSILKEEVEKARYKKVDDEAEEVATLMPRTWVTLHVYISTTHEDMHCERDVMMEDVFPSLNTRLRDTQIRVVPIDLRYGTPKAAMEIGPALEVCLHEINRCRPFFVGVYGERYGFVPDAEKLPNYGLSDDPQFQWVKDIGPGYSFTHIEILHAIVKRFEKTFLHPTVRARLPISDHHWATDQTDDGGPSVLLSEEHRKEERAKASMRSYFYFRDPSFLEDPSYLEDVALEGDERRTAEEEEAVTLNERKAEDPLQQWRIGLTDRIKADLQAFFDLDLTVENFEDDWDSSGGNKLLQNEVARDWWVLPRVGTQLELHFLRRIGMPPGEGCYIINDESFGRIVNPIKVDVMIDLDAEELVACRIDDILMPKWMRPSKRIQKIRASPSLDDTYGRGQLTDEQRARLWQMKEEIRGQATSIFDRYPVHYGSFENPDEGGSLIGKKIKLFGLEHFAERMVNDLYAAVMDYSSLYLSRTLEIVKHPAKLEMLQHRAMMMDLAQLHVSREDMMASILEYIHEPMEIVAPLVIVGEKGSGKSALISAVGKMLTQKYRDSRKVIVLHHYIGPLPQSCDGRRLLLNLVHLLSEGVENSSQHIPEDFASLSYRLPRLLDLMNNRLFKRDPIMEKLKNQLIRGKQPKKKLEKENSVNGIANYERGQDSSEAQALEADALLSLIAPPKRKDNSRYHSKTFASEETLPEADRRANDNATFVIMMDGLNALSEDYGARSLEWFPLFLPKNLRTIITTIPGDPALEELKKKFPTLQVLHVPPLLPIDRKEIIQQLLSTHRRRLTTDQLTHIVSKKRSDLPELLKFAYRHVLLLRDFRGATRLLQRYSDTLKGVCDIFIARLEEKFGPILVRNSLLFLRLSHGGLTAEELFVIVKREEEKNYHLDPVTWARLFHEGLFPFLSPPSLPRSRTRILTFVSSSFVDAIDERYLIQDDKQNEGKLSGIAEDFYVELQKEATEEAVKAKRRRGSIISIRSVAGDKTIFHKGPEKQVISLRTCIHQCLADFFWTSADPEGTRTWRGREYRSFAFLAPHLLSGWKWDELGAILTDLSFVERVCALGLTEDILALMVRSLDVDRSIYWWRQTTDVASFASFLRRNSSWLNERPWLCFQSALNEPDSLSVSAMARRRVQVGWDGRSYLELLNKADRIDPCSCVFYGHSSWVRAAAFNADCDLFASCSDDKTVRLWDPSSGLPLGVLQGHKSQSQRKSEEAVVYVASGSADGGIKLWDSVSTREIATLSGHTTTVTTLAFNSSPQQVIPFGREKLEAELIPGGAIRLVSGSRDGAVNMRDVETGKLVATMKGHEKAVTSVRWLSRGHFFMTASHDGMAFLWDAFTGARVCSKLVHTGGVSSLDIAEDASKMASVGAERQLKVWTIDFSAVARPQLKEHPDWIVRLNADTEDVAISLRQRVVVTGSRDAKIRLFDMEDGSQILGYLGHTKPVKSVVFSPDGLNLISTSADKTIRLWSLDLWHVRFYIRMREKEKTRLDKAAEAKALATARVQDKLTGWREMLNSFRA